MLDIVQTDRVDIRLALGEFGVEPHAAPVTFKSIDAERDSVNAAIVEGEVIVAGRLAALKPRMDSSSCTSWPACIEV